MGVLPQLLLTEVPVQKVGKLLWSTEPDSWKNARRIYPWRDSMILYFTVCRLCFCFSTANFLSKAL